MTQSTPSCAFLLPKTSSRTVRFTPQTQRPRSKSGRRSARGGFGARLGNKKRDPPNAVTSTLSVDKILSGIKAVQTLSRLNRAHPQKHDAFVLDFMNDVDTIQEAFADYYRTTVLSEETDPNKLHDLKAALDGYQVYADAEIDQLVTLYLDGADRDQLDPILDACVELQGELDEDGQVDFKGEANARRAIRLPRRQCVPYKNASVRSFDLRGSSSCRTAHPAAGVTDDLSKVP